MLDIKSGKKVHLGAFHTAYAAALTAALTAALSKEKGLQDQRDATLLSGCLTTAQAEQTAEEEGLTLRRNSARASGFTNVALHNSTEYSLRPFTIRQHMFLSMPADCARAYTSAAHAALVIARHKATFIYLDA